MLAIPDHVERTAVVLDDLRLAYVPVPKAASTSILCALAEFLGSPTELRVHSRKLEVTRNATVHDGSMWEPSQRLLRKSPDEHMRILHSEDWFRFTVVREPVRRMWSAWVSKVLVRDPRFVVSFGDDLFPAPPSSSNDVLEGFRRFVAGLPTRSDWHDVHWTSQVELIGVPEIPYALIGRTEAIDDVEALVSSYVLQQGGRALPALRRENRSFLPYSPAVLDEPAHDACVRFTNADCEAFGYEPLEYAGSSPNAVWHAAVDAALPAIRALIEHNERFLDVWRLRERDERPQRTQRRRKAIVALGVAGAVSLSGLLGITRGS